MFDIEHIIKIIKKSGYSCSAVEKALGFGNGSIRRWKQSYPSINKLYALSNFLSVPICELLGENIKPQLSENESQLLEIYNNLNKANQTILMAEALKLQKEEQYLQVAAMGGKITSLPDSELIDKDIEKTKIIKSSTNYKGAKL